MIREKPCIVIVEDHPIMRNGLADYFTKTGRWQVAGTAPTLQEAKNLLAGTQADVVLIDIQLEDGWGLDIIPWYAQCTEFARRTRSAKSRAGLVPLMAVYTSFDDYAHVSAAMSLGVRAYITKRQDEQDLENALLKVLAGETYVDDTALFLLDTVKNQLRLLSKREMEIFTLVKQKHSNKQIAGNLGISTRTVENILSCVYDKMGIRSRYELERL